MEWCFLLPYFTFHLFLLLTPFPSYTHSMCSHHDSSALLQFMNSLTLRTSNDSFYYQCYSSLSTFKTESWKNGTDCCNWDGVTCNNLSGHVIGLDLSCGQLKGELYPNSTIFKLRHLQQLNLAYNNFSGSSIHSEIGDLVSLTHLNLSDSRIGGDIPPVISHLSKLVSLSLGSYFGDISMSLDPFVWQKLILNATNLRELHLDGVDMSSYTGRSLSLLMNLSSSLVSLSLKGNRLSGPIPNVFGKLIKLESIDLSSNNLSGQVPSSLFNLTQLSDLYLSYNNLVGPIPNEITEHSKLVSLYLYGNMLSGTIPQWCYSLPSLEYLYLDDNRLTGSVGEFSTYSLKGLFLSNNKLQGEFPSTIFKLENLTELGLSSNNLSGPVDFHQFSNLKKLEILLLSKTSFHFFNNSADYIVPNLKYVLLSSSNISRIPTFLKSLPNLLYLDLSNNKIHGEIPEWFHKKLLHSWKYIYHIDLSFNKFQGDLPILPNGIGYFFASNNNFTGEIASTLCNASSLYILNLAHNNLTGVIPQCLASFPYLSVLDLQMNNLYGSMPRNFSKGNAFETIKLNGNQLEGPLPQSLAHCTNLKVLDLGDNNIKEEFPNWLETLQELQVLSLRTNKLHGAVTCSSMKHPFPKLRIFDVSNNSFNGPLPKSCIKNFQGMVKVNDNQTRPEYMGEDRNYYNDSIVVIMKGLYEELTRILTKFTTIDLSNNMFEGEIPEVIGELHSLKGLNLSHNGITGTIPQSLSNLTNLEWLDLSRNKLKGDIPVALTNLTSLSKLDLSQNQLEGIIPTGKQFNTFGNDSYEGNPLLCGLPLSKSCKNDEEQQPYLTFDDEEESGFGWKAVVIGYACGAVFGALVGYNVLLTGKPQWLARLVEEVFNTTLKRENKRVNGNRRGMN